METMDIISKGNPMDAEAILNAVAYIMKHYDGKYIVSRFMRDEEWEETEPDYYTIYQLKIDKPSLIDALENQMMYAKTYEPMDAYNVDGYFDVEEDEKNLDKCGDGTEKGMSQVIATFDLSQFYNPYIPAEYFDHTSDGNCAECFRATKDNPMPDMKLLTADEMKEYLILARHFEKLRRETFHSNGDEYVLQNKMMQLFAKDIIELIKID